MFNKIIQFFTSIFTHEVRGGLIPDPRSDGERATDKIVGTTNSLPMVPLLPSADWREYQVRTEAQSSPLVFDTAGCTTFSAGEQIEQLIIFKLLAGKVSQKIVDRLRELGFFSDPANFRTFKLSKRFNIILNGTTKYGNYFQRVADYYRNVGFIPDSMLPFGGQTWSEYADPNVITNDMVRIAREMLSYFDIAYEMGSVNTYDGINQAEQHELSEIIKCGPLQIAITAENPHHAQLLQRLSAQKQYILDTYEPYIVEQKINKPKIAYYMRYVVTVKEALPVTLKRNLYLGMNGDDIEEMQKMLGISADGIFGPGTKRAVISFQSANGLKADGIVGPATWEKMEEKGLKKK